MRNNSYSPSPRSSQSQSRSPTPRHSYYYARSKTPTKKTNSYTSPKQNLNQTIHNIITVIIFLLILLLIYLISSVLSPPSNFCTDKSDKLCRKCPDGANCTINNFTCNDQSEVKFFDICHKPGNFFNTENLTLLYKYQYLLYNFVESQKGQVTLSKAVEANLQLSDQPSIKLDSNDIEIIWTYDNHYFIDENGFLRFHPSPMVFVSLYSFIILLIIAILCYVNYRFFS